MQHKTISYFLAVTLSCILVGCQREGPSQSGELVKQSFNAISTGALETKTSLDGLNVNWVIGDKIAVYDASATVKPFSATASGPTVVFEGLAQNSETGTYYGLYPYDANLTSWTGTAFKSTIPQFQYVAGELTNWDPNATVAVGICDSEDHIMPFFNAHALIKVIMPNTIPSSFTPTAVTVTGNHNENLAGFVTVTPSPTPQITLDDNHWTAVTLNKSTGIAPSESVYLAVYPTTLNGMTVYITGNQAVDGGTSIPVMMHIRSSTDEAVTLVRNRILVLDFREKTIPTLGQPITLQNNNHGLIGLLSSEFGNSVFEFGTNASYHADTWSTVVYDETLTAPVTFDSHETIAFEKIGTTYPFQYRIHFTRGAHEGKYFGYSQEMQVNYIVSNVSDAFVFYVFQIQ